MTFFVGDLRNALPAALNASSSSTSRAEQRKLSAGAVPVLVLVPVQQAGGVSALHTLQQGDVLLGVSSAVNATTMTTALSTGSVSAGQHRGLQRALPRLGANVILQHQVRLQQLQQLQQLQPALREASARPASPASSASSSSRSPGPSALSASSPSFVPQATHPRAAPAAPSDTESVVSDLAALPSFGARTAAAKQLLSAAPGGPVFGHRTSGHVGLNNSPWDSAFGQKKKFKKVFCPFCKKNGERKETYTAHGLNERSPDGSVRVICPVLRSLRCEICGATGDKAHTRTHCPMGMSLLPVATILKSTQRRCDGSKRSFL